jgi:hypothetical protein
MRRVCFDTASDYYWDGTRGWLNGPADAREQFRGRSFDFRAATAFVHATGRSFDFLDPKDLFNCLAEADEIITFNGRTCDLIVLEFLVGEGAMRKLWHKPHHDLKGWKNNWKLQTAVDLLPKKVAQSFDSVKSARSIKLLQSPYSDSTKDDLAGTYRDAKFTLDVFRLYLASGETQFTFRDQLTIE